MIDDTKNFAEPGRYDDEVRAKPPRYAALGWDYTEEDMADDDAAVLTPEEFDKALGGDFVVRTDGTWRCECGATNRGHKRFPTQEEALKRARKHRRKCHGD